jgi:hypothetical protein
MGQNVKTGSKITTKEKTSLKVHKSLKQKYIYIQLTNRSGQNLAFSSVWSFFSEFESV